MKWFSINGILTEMKRIRWPKGKDLAKTVRRSSHLQLF